MNHHNYNSKFVLPSKVFKNDKKTAWMNNAFPKTESIQILSNFSHTGTGNWGRETIYQRFIFTAFKSRPTFNSVTFLISIENFSQFPFFRGFHAMSMKKYIHPNQIPNLLSKIL